MSGRDWRLDFVLMMGFGTGLYSFLKGFRIYREYRILEDTPEAPVRAIAMGLVHVRGRAAGEERLTSPLTRTPCYFYKVDIEKWERDQNRSRWRHYTTDVRGLRFYVEDTTGKVLVDPNGAECDLVRRGQRVIGDSGFSLRSLFEKKAAPWRIPSPLKMRSETISRICTPTCDFPFQLKTHRPGRWPG